MNDVQVASLKAQIVVEMIHSATEVVKALGSWKGTVPTLLHGLADKAMILLDKEFESFIKSSDE